MNNVVLHIRLREMAATASREDLEMVMEAMRQYTLRFMNDAAKTLGDQQINITYVGRPDGQELLFVITGNYVSMCAGIAVSAVISCLHQSPRAPEALKEQVGVVSAVGQLFRYHVYSMRLRTNTVVSLTRNHLRDSTLIYHLEKLPSDHPVKEHVDSLSQGLEEQGQGYFLSLDNNILESLHDCQAKDWLDAQGDHVDPVHIKTGDQHKIIHFYFPVERPVTAPSPSPFQRRGGTPLARLLFWPLVIACLMLLAVVMVLAFLVARGPGGAPGGADETAGLHDLELATRSLRAENEKKGRLYDELDRRYQDLMDRYVLAEIKYQQLFEKTIASMVADDGRIPEIPLVPIPREILPEPEAEPLAAATPSGLETTAGQAVAPPKTARDDGALTAAAPPPPVVNTLVIVRAASDELTATLTDTLTKLFNDRSVRILREPQPPVTDRARGIVIDRELLATVSPVTPQKVFVVEAGASGAYTIKRLFPIAPSMMGMAEKINRVGSPYYRVVSVGSLEQINAVLKILTANSGAMTRAAVEPPVRVPGQPPGEVNTEVPPMTAAPPSPRSVMLLRAAMKARPPVISPAVKAQTAPGELTPEAFEAEVKAQDLVRRSMGTCIGQLFNSVDGVNGVIQVTLCADRRGAVSVGNVRLNLPAGAMTRAEEKRLKRCVGNAFKGFDVSSYQVKKRTCVIYPYYVQ